jgi:hypothetical protein
MTLTEKATTDQEEASRIVEHVRALDAKLKTQSDSADAILAKCEDAMRASTSLGLAGAFHEQAKSLTRSMAYWVGGLVGALLSKASLGAAAPFSRVFTASTSDADATESALYARPT